MPLELSIWRMDSGLSRVEPTTLNLEARLEDILAPDISVAASNWMVIGRQVPTPWGKRIDILCIDSEGNLVVLELKRDKTEREVVAQALDYGSYVRTIQAEEVPRLFNAYQKDYYPGQPAKSLNEAFCARFGLKQMPEELNGSHELVIVASVLDAATERIVGYLAGESGVSINAVFFRVFKDEGREYLTRVWLRDPTTPDDASVTTSGPKEKGEWNGEYHVNFGHDDGWRNWDDAVKYGFVSAGGGERFRDAMIRLEPNDRVWVNVPGSGYVGVGVVEDAAVRLSEFMVSDDKGDPLPILQAPLKCKDMGARANDPEMTEYLVRVKWIKTVPLAQACEADTPDAAQRRARGQRWADLMRRTFGFDVLACPRCGGRLRLIALIEEAAVIGRILRHLGVPTETPVPRPARAPPLPEGTPDVAGWDDDTLVFEPCS